MSTIANIPAPVLKQEETESSISQRLSGVEPITENAQRKLAPSKTREYKLERHREWYQRNKFNRRASAMKTYYETRFPPEEAERRFQKYMIVNKLKEGLEQM